MQENENKAECVATLHITQLICEKARWCAMETILIKLTLLLFFGLVTITIIAIALIITLVIIISK